MTLYERVRVCGLCIKITVTYILPENVHNMHVNILHRSRIIL